MNPSNPAETTLPDSQKDEGSLLEKMRGLDYYRRRRPYSLVVDDQGGWWVYDAKTAETFGRVARAHDEQLDNYIEIDLEQSPDPSYELQEHVMGTQTRDFSIHEAADRLWKAVYPIRSKSWLAMQRIVLGYDWVLSLLQVGGRLGLVLVVLAFIVGSISFLWEARDLLQANVLQWLEGFRD